MNYSELSEIITRQFAFGLDCGSGFFNGCLIIALPYIIAYAAPFILVIFLILLFGYKLIKHKSPSGKYIFVMITVSLILGGFSAYQYREISTDYKAINSFEESVSKMKTTLFEPTYAPQNYELYDMSASGGSRGRLRYEYLNKQDGYESIRIIESAQDADSNPNFIDCPPLPNEFDGTGQASSCEKFITENGTDFYSYGIGYLVFKEDTSITISASDITVEEVGRIIDGLAPIEAQDIKFINN